MKTTLEIPNDLFREAKAKAAMEGIKLKDLVARGLEREVRGGPAARGKTRKRVKLPLIRCAPGTPKMDLTAERIHQLEMKAELERQ
jgi:hypothetical protein